MKRSRRLRWLGGLAALALLATACGDDDSPSDVGATPDATDATDTTGTTTEESSALAGWINGQEDPPDPVAGGELTIGIFQETAGLDPIVSFGSGVAGATELAAIYDVLMRYDARSGQFEPRLAESLESNDDNTEWTLRLRPNVKFTDGTALDAAAVQFNLERHQNSRSVSAGRVGLIKEFSTPDELTLVMRLDQPFSGFPYLLADLPGMIGSPTAIQQLGDEQFNRAPVGAGPFKVASWTAGDRLVLEKNPDYWDGEVHLDKLTFLRAGDSALTYEAVKSGDVDVAILRDPQTVKKANDEGQPGYVNLRPGGLSIAFNAGIGGNEVPTSDARVRRAVAMAIDTEVINQRAFGGSGLPGTQLFPETSRWFVDVPGIAHDPDGARALLAEVQQETGWDGALTLVSNNASQAQDIANALKTMLDAAGFKVTLDNQFNSGVQTTKMIVDGNFDMATWACNVDEAGVWVWLNQCLHSTHPLAFGFADAEMDQLLDELKSAPDDDAARETIKAISELFNELAPYVPLGQTTEAGVWADNVYGIEASETTILLFNNAFKA